MLSFKVLRGYLAFHFRYGKVSRLHLLKACMDAFLEWEGFVEISIVNEQRTV
jgi:hypothetical protein